MVRLLDARVLAEVYLELIGGRQPNFLSSHLAGWPRLWGLGMRRVESPGLMRPARES